MSETSTVKEEKSSPLPTEQLFPLNIKIKQEKTTDSSKSETVDKLSIDLNLTNIFSATTTTTTTTATSAATPASDDTEKETKVVEPLKSSNEILTELFKVFNAAPPEIVEDDSNDGEEGGKKKKHKKHKKKSKKRKKGENGSGSSSDSEPEEGEIKRKAKKIKKEKDKDKSKHKKSKEKDKEKVKKEKKGEEDGKKEEKVSVKTEITSVVVKKEPRDDRYGSRDTRERDDRYSSRDSRDTRDSRDIRDSRDSYHSHHHHHHHGSSSRDDHPRIKQEKDDRSYRDSARDKEKDRDRDREREKDEPKSKGRIQIKSLKDSTIFKEAAASRERQRSRERERDRTTSEGRSKSREMHRRRRSDSDFSMSDEETYKQQQGQGRYYDFYQKKYNSFYASYRDEEYDRSRKRKRSEDRDRYRKSRSKSRSRSPPQFDKQKLLEIARKNAITMLKKGTLPGAQGLDKESKEKLIMKMKSSGKTIDELTNFCKKISEKENLNELSSVSSDDSDHDAEGGSKAFHHPFQLKDHGPIVMNIKNSVPLQPKSAEQTKALLLQYPVSSGAQHRKMENEWVPVEPPTTAGPLVPLVRPDKATPKLPITASFVPQAEKQQPAYTPVNPPLGTPAAICQPGPSTAPPQINTPALPIDIPNALPAPPVNPTDTTTPEVFPSNPEGNKLDVSTIISNRLNAMRKLQDNPADAEAIKLLYNTQKDMSAWASSKFTPGQFLGSTGAQVLTPRELAEGYQPWVTKDSMKQTAPVTGGMGMHLLQKMGWVPGEGLGKEKNGSLEPLLLDVKLDKRGLVASAEEHQRQIQFQVQQQHNGRGRPRFTNVKINVDGKHPVSILGEYASKRKWNPPRYDLVHESGPGHAKNFVFKVIVNGLEYQPAISNNTKKDAKATAARFCLQQLGILQS